MMEDVSSRYFIWNALALLSNASAYGSSDPSAAHHGHYQASFGLLLHMVGSGQ